MELTVVLPGFRSVFPCAVRPMRHAFSRSGREADPVAAVRVPEDALKGRTALRGRYHAGAGRISELGPRVCDALLPYGRILFHGAAILWRRRVWVFTANSGTGKTTQYML